MGHKLPFSATPTPSMASVMAEIAKFTRRQYVLSPYGELFDLPFLGSYFDGYYNFNEEASLSDAPSTSQGSYCQTNLFCQWSLFALADGTQITIIGSSNTANGGYNLIEIQFFSAQASIMAEMTKFTRRQYVSSPYGELFDLPFLGS
ncbi:hypothetical protein WN943_023867 [Citrus x changshan-huyou]